MGHIARGCCEEECGSRRGKRGPRGHDGEAGERGATGPTGATGPVGPGFTVTPFTAARLINTPFVPSLTNNVFGIYTVEFEAEVIAPQGTDLIVQLLSDASNPPTTVRASARLQNIGSLGDLIRARQVLSYIVPLGHSVELRLVQNVGGGTVLVVDSTEEIFSPAP